MSLAWAFGARMPASFPRVSGDEPVLIRRVGVEEQFSPRERG